MLRLAMLNGLTNKKYTLCIQSVYQELHRAAQIHRISKSGCSVRIWFPSHNKGVQGGKISCRFHRHYPHQIPLESEVQIFTLGGSIWRSPGEIPKTLFPRRTQASVNGRLHWCAWPRNYYWSIIPRTCGPNRLLVSFDLADEKFRVIPEPNGSRLGWCTFDPVILGGCLSAAVDYNNGKFEIWVMKNYVEKESWKKEFSIGNYLPTGMEQDMSQSFTDSKFHKNSSFVRALCLLKNGDILQEYQCRALVSYNPKDGTFKDVLFQEMPYLFEDSVHEGSLNWIATLVDL